MNSERGSATGRMFALMGMMLMGLAFVINIRYNHFGWAFLDAAAFVLNAYMYNLN